MLTPAEKHSPCDKCEQRADEVFRIGSVRLCRRCLARVYRNEVQGAASCVGCLVLLLAGCGVWYYLNTWTGAVITLGVGFFLLVSWEEWQVSQIGDETIDEFFSSEKGIRRVEEEFLGRSFAGDGEDYRDEIAREVVEYLEEKAPDGRPDEAPALEGRCLGGTYEITEFLGSGGFGTVWKATDDQGRAWAVKVPKQHGEDMFGRWEPTQLEHDNIAAIHEIHRTEEPPFLVMEYVEGVSLDRLLPARGFTVPVALGIFRQILEALEYAHEQNAIHRDLKPANLMVDREGRVKILDFCPEFRSPAQRGEALEHSLARPEAEEVVGTWDYMAPELKHDSTYTGQVDLYSAGVILFELLTGRHPARGERPSDVVPLDWRARRIDAIFDASCIVLPKRAKSATELLNLLRPAMRKDIDSNGG